jgi:lipoyl(octanoyl) transferase
MKPEVKFKWIRDLSYHEVWELQTIIHKDLIDKKRLAGTEYKPLHHLIFCEHHHVYTLGKSGSTDHLLLSEEQISEEGIEFFKINRGGDITYHGPGQITGYPVFDLEDFFRDVHRFVRLLEEAVIQCIKEYGLKGIRLNGYTGVWLAPDDQNVSYRKICAIGVHLSRWVSMHGFAFNVDTDLAYFGHIIPCGITDEDKTVTSLSVEVGRKISVQEAGEVLRLKLAEVFDYNYTENV